ncbi:MAG: Flp pilus assembly protein protease CpaA [Kiritimatiellia bacterium]
MIAAPMLELSIMDVVVWGAFCVACWTDLTTKRIPNALTFPLWGIGVVYYLVFGPWWVGLMGLAITLPLHFALFALGIDKGGDAKLMVGAGACLGWWVALEATVWHVLLMLPVGLILAALMGRLPNVWRTFKHLFKRIYYAVMKLEAGPGPEQTYVAKAPVLIVGLVLARFTPWLETLLLDDATRAWVQGG